MLVDSHVHLDAPQFEEDREDVIERAREQQVDLILSIGCLQDSPHIPRRLLDLVQREPAVYAAFGVHPHDARFLNRRIEEEIRLLLDHPKVLAVGEIGLDFYYDNSPRMKQRDAFLRQVELAQELRAPIIIHTREADEETFQILEEYYSESPACAGVFHCFSGDERRARRCLDLGFYISAGGMLTFKNSSELRETVRNLPRDRFLLETDAPYLAPVPFRGKRNEPAYVSLVAREVARLWGVSPDEVAELTTQNFRRLFGVPVV